MRRLAALQLRTLRVADACAACRVLVVVAALVVARRRTEGTAEPESSSPTVITSPLRCALDAPVKRARPCRCVSCAVCRRRLRTLTRFRAP